MSIKLSDEQVYCIIENYIEHTYKNIQVKIIGKPNNFNSECRLMMTTPCKNCKLIYHVSFIIDIELIELCGGEKIIEDIELNFNKLMPKSDNFCKVCEDKFINLIRLCGR